MHLRDPSMRPAAADARGDRLGLEPIGGPPQHRRPFAQFHTGGTAFLRIRGDVLGDGIDLIDGLRDLLNPILLLTGRGRASDITSRTRSACRTISDSVARTVSLKRTPGWLETDSSMSEVVLRAASALRMASPRTSSATTAKPRPASPARAASTAALSASRLV